MNMIRQLVIDTREPPSYIADSNAGIGGMGLAEVFARRLKEEIAEKGWSQYQFAQEAGVTRSYISQLILGRTSPKLDTIEKYADVLNVPAWTLLVDSKYRRVNHAAIPEKADFIRLFSQVDDALRESGARWPAARRISLALDLYELLLETGESPNVAQAVQLLARQGAQS